MTHVQTISPVQRAYNDLVATNLATSKPSALRALRAALIGTVKAHVSESKADELSKGPTHPTTEWFEQVKGILADAITSATPAQPSLIPDEAPAKRKRGKSIEAAAQAVATPAVEPVAEQSAALTEARLAATAPVAETAPAVEPVAEQSAALTEARLAATAPVAETAPAVEPVTDPAPAADGSGAYTLPKWVRQDAIDAAAKIGIDLRRVSCNSALQLTIALVNMGAPRGALERAQSLNLPDDFNKRVEAVIAELTALAKVASAATLAPATKRERSKSEARALAVGDRVKLSKAGAKDTAVVESIGSADSIGTVTRVVTNTEAQPVRVFVDFDGLRVSLPVRAVELA